MKKFALPVWFPYPNSWLSALMLSVFMGGVLALFRRSDGLVYNLPKWSDSPEKFTVWLILLLILPIPAIAFFHHFFLSRFISPIPGEKIKSHQGFFPGVSSWWASLYTWMVLVVSTLITTLFCTPFLALFQLNYNKIISNSNEINTNIQAIFAFVWLACAAIFYQIEYLVKCRLVFGEPVSSVPDEVSTVELNSDENHEVGTTDIQTNSETTKEKTKEKTNVFTLVAKQQNLLKNLLKISVIALVGAWLYLFVNLPQVKEVSTNFADQIRLVVQTEPTPVNSKLSDSSLQIDSFEEAVNLAQSAKLLTKSANTQEEWKTVVGKWKAAIALMKTVPSDSPNYIAAESKIAQYQSKLDLAEKNIVNSR